MKSIVFKDQHELHKVEFNLSCLSAVLSTHGAQAPELPAVSSAWRRGDTLRPLPVDTSSAGSASQSGATPRSALAHE